MRLAYWGGYYTHNVWLNILWLSHKLFPRKHYFQQAYSKEIAYMGETVIGVEFTWFCRCGAIEKRTRDIHIYDKEDV